MSEAALAGKLIHPHIVTILDAVVDEHISYVAMEYVHGGNLSRYTVAERLLPVADVIEIAFKCCGALDYAYREGVVHRDIKPANILVAEGTDVKVADFGAAFVRDVETTQQHARRLALLHRSGADSRRPAHASERHVLPGRGAVRASGRPPARSTGRNTAEILRQGAERGAAAPTQLRPDLPAAARRGGAAHAAEVPGRPLSGLGRAGVGPGADRPPQRLRSARSRTARSSLLCGPRHCCSQFSDAEVWELTRIGAVAAASRRRPCWCAKANRATACSFSREGEAKVTARGRLLNVLRAGDCFGEMAYVRGETTMRQATVETSTDVLVVELPRSALDALSRRLPAAAQSRAAAHARGSARVCQRCGCAPGRGPEACSALTPADSAAPAWSAACSAR